MDFEARLLDDLGAAVAVQTAAECGLLRQLARSSVAYSDLSLPPAHGDILLALLTRSGVLTQVEGVVAMTPDMQALMDARAADFLVRLDFALQAAADMILGRQAFFSDQRAFMERAATFGFYCYGRAMKTGPGNLQDTAPWVAHVSALSRLEAPDLSPLLAFHGEERVLEIGGNDGSFARAVLQRWPALDWTVLDLPAVCALGRQAAGDGAEPKFLPGDMRSIDWPEADVILFKSVLHDWEAMVVEALLQRAATHLGPGGRVMILERGPVQQGGLTGNLLAASNLVFAGFYRDPDWYKATLEALDMKTLRSEPVQLDLPFHLISGHKP